MGRQLGSTPIRCGARTQALWVDGCIIRWQCRDKRCDDVALARENEQKAYHNWNTRDGSFWTDFEPADRRQAKE